MPTNKMKQIYTEYKNTTVIEGSAFLFSSLFWLTKILSFLQHQSSLLNIIIHRIVRLLPKPSFVIQNMSGIFLVHAFDDSTTICSDYFERDLRGWLTTPDHKDIFLDIGANRGIYSIIAPTRFGYSNVEAFEPNPKVINILSKNVALNNLQNKVTIHQIALGSESGSANFACDPMHLGGGRIVTSPQTEPIKVPVLALDNLVPRIPSERISFVKIDTEGYEFSVLAGMKDTLEHMIPGTTLMIESTETEELTSLLEKYNFKHLQTNKFDHLFQKHA